MKQLQWKKGLFECAYKIISAGKEVGRLTENPWSQSAHGYINERRLGFRVKSIWTPNAEIIDLDKQEILGNINFSCWWSKARVDYKGRSFIWKYKNLWSTKYRLQEVDGSQIDYQGWSSHGSVKSKLNEDVLLMTGLFIANYYWNMVAVYFVCIFIPMFVLFL